MKQKGKIQIGHIILDAEIDLDIQIPEMPPIVEGTVVEADQPFATIKAFMKKYPKLWPTSVEGSIAAVPLQIEGPEVKDESI